MNWTEKVFSLKGQQILITGGGGVIAGWLAEAFLASGADICLWGRGESSLLSSYQRLTSQGHPLRYQVVNCDLVDEVKKALKDLVSQGFQPTVLVNGVGGTKGLSDTLEVSISHFSQVIALNLLAGMLIPTQILARYWILNKMSASVINIASIASYQYLSQVAAYDAAKVAVLHLTKGLAREFADYGIRVNALTPGFFLGKQNRALLVKDDGTPTARGQQVLNHTPMKRFGEGEDLKAAAVFLASAQASGFVTGTDILVDGGFCTYSI